MKKEYLNYLIVQFMEADNIKNKDLNSEAFRKEFAEWLYKRQQLGKDYLNLLENIGIHHIDEPDTAEVGKGKFDTVVGSLSTTMITPFSDGIKTRSNKIVINSSFNVWEGDPIIINGTFFRKFPIESRNFHTFMTQNPYDKSAIKDWNQMHNQGYYDIIVGVYGNTYDKDINQKRKALQELKEKMYDDYVEEHVIIDDQYYNVLASKRHIKTLKRGLTR